MISLEVVPEESAGDRNGASPGVIIYEPRVNQRGVVKRGVRAVAAVSVILAAAIAETAVLIGTVRRAAQ